MTNEQHTFELIEAYLNGQLSGKELEHFNFLLKENSAFAKEVEIQQLASIAIIDHELAGLKSKLKNYTPQTKSKSWNNKLLTIAAALLVLGTAIYFFSTTPEKSKNNMVSGSEKEISKVAENQEQGSEQPANDTNLDKNSIEKNNGKEVVKNDSVIHHSPTEHNLSEIPSNETAAKHTPDSVKQVFSLPNCDQVEFKAHISTTPACKGEHDGKIFIISKSVSGGVSPYEFSIDQGKHFQKASHFENVSEGQYQITIRDKNGCISSIKTPASVQSQACKSLQEYSFNPSTETWKFPIKDNSSAELSIFSKSGTEVYKTSIQNGNPSEWDGRSNSGMELESGIYAFQIHYGNGRIDQGYITIKR